MTACADHVFTMAEADLKRAYGAVKARLDDQALEQLKAAQRAWTAYRHEWCDFIARPWRGGSIYPMIHAQCLTELTEAQTEKLWAQSGCEEGDLFCTGG